MKNILFLFFFIFTFSNAQEQGDFWCFGNNATLDFRSGVPVAGMNTMISELNSASICNEFGQLQFYANHNTIYNKNGVPMPNGLGILGDTGKSQSIIFQDLVSPNLYYYVYTELLIPSSYADMLLYSVIDMNLDGGNGDVVTTSKNIILYNRLDSIFDKLTGFVDPVNSRTGIIFSADNDIITFYASGGSFSTNTIVSNVPALGFGSFLQGPGIIKISPDLTKIVLTYASAHVHSLNEPSAFLLDYNVNTGQVTNTTPLAGSDPNIPFFYGAEFSPDSNLLYLSATSHIMSLSNTNTSRTVYQFDINSSQPNWNSTPYQFSINTGGVGQLQLAPDGKIYHASLNAQALSVVEHPNVLGVGANYSHNTIPLFTNTSCNIGLPQVVLGLNSQRYNYINGNIFLDVANDGCDISDPAISSYKINVSSNSLNIIGIYENTHGYVFNLPDDFYTITPQLETPSYWNISPASATVDFPAQSSPHTQDLCVTANGTVEDLEVFVLPLEQARPGFDTDYLIRIKNKGNQTASGIVTLDYEEDFMTLLSSTPIATQSATNQLSWSFSNLQPFQMEDYAFTMTLNTPTDPSFPLNGGDVLTYTGMVTGQGIDTTPADNTMTFDQTVVNAYDPNDKTCLEGETIEPTIVGEYVHYMIRFENTGTASAINVVVKDEIDINQFDITTLVPLGGSHDYYVRIKEGNIVEFIHEDINLDFNDATNDGHVLFKIKTLSTLSDGDTFDNTAQIYFDFNAPIVTNTEMVTVMSTASVGQMTDSSVSVYPNPASGVLNITGSHSINSITLYDLNGRLLSKYHFTDEALNQQIDVSSLGSGIYFMNIESSTGSATHKIVVE